MTSRHLFGVVTPSSNTVLEPLTSAMLAQVPGASAHFSRFTVTQSETILAVYHADAGQGLPRHEHLYSHLTICTAGRCIIRKEARQLEMTKDTQPVNLVAAEWHEIEALEDGTVFINVFAA